MFIVAGVLLGAVVLAALVGFHTGPHTHAAAGVLGVVAAGWLVLMMVDGSARRTLLLSLFAADLVVSAGMGLTAWRGIVSRRAVGSARPAHDVAGAAGIAVGGLSPTGAVRVRGELWSATSLNGPVADGAPVQVVSVDGIRLNVWSEGGSDALAPNVERASDRLFVMDPDEPRSSGSSDTEGVAS